jgi:hypothetical protein
MAQARPIERIPFIVSHDFDLRLENPHSSEFFSLLNVALKRAAAPPRVSRAL